MIGTTNNQKEGPPLVEHVWYWPPTYNVGYGFEQVAIIKDEMFIYGYETSSGHEGFTLKLTHLTVGKRYRFSIYYQNTNAAYIGTSYCVGYKIADNTSAANMTSSNYGSWEQNILRNSNFNYTEKEFTCTADPMYIGFAGNGYSDDQRNYFRFTKMRIIEI